MKHSRDFWIVFGALVLGLPAVVAIGALTIMGLVWATRHFEYTPVVVMVLFFYLLARGITDSPATKGDTNARS